MSVDSCTDKWPKVLPPLTAEQQVVHDDFVKRWHEVLPEKYGALDRFGHEFVVRESTPAFRSTLEIGAGLGEHLDHETLTPDQRAGYHVVELRENMATRLRERHPSVNVDVGDCQERLAFEDGSIDRHIAIHVLEHLPNLPACIKEAHRVLEPGRGELLVVIPCEGSLAYTLGRRVSAQRLFEKTYKMPYTPFISREHINLNTCTTAKPPMVRPGLGGDP